MSTEGETSRKSYLHYLITPLKICGCWGLFGKPKTEKQYTINGVYLGFVLFSLVQIPVALSVHLHTEWEDVMSSLDKIADFLPLMVSLAIVAYSALNRKKLYELVEFMDEKFKYRSAAGVTNMSMERSYVVARNLWKIYTACTMFSVTMYALMPVLIHLWTQEAIQHWMYNDADQSSFYQVITFVRCCIAQLFVGLAMGQFGVFFAANSILICGQLDILCCSLRNARFTALLLQGASHTTLASAYGDLKSAEIHHYMYNVAEMREPEYHYDKKMSNKVTPRTQFDIYSPQYDSATVQALKECAIICQLVNRYKEMFEQYASPLLTLRVVQVTLYLCILLYAATLNFDTMTVEYLAAVALDIFVYCYYGNQIILQADRVSTAAYHSAWHTMGVRPRRVLLNILLANRRPMVVRAGRFLPMDLHTFVVIIKTSFSYYTLLVNVNEK